MNPSKPSQIFLKILKFIREIDYRGIDKLNDYFPKLGLGYDRISEWAKGILWFIIGISMLMMFVYPHGWLYACFPRPFAMITHFIWDNYSPLVESINAPTPEWGLHYTTIITVAFFMIRGIESFENQQIEKPFHKLSYVFTLGIVSLFVPFELIYITLYDIFHSIPKFGYPAIWTFGYWKPFPKNILQSVFMYDVVLPIMCFMLLYLIYKDLREYYPIKINKNKFNVGLFIAFLFSMFMWVVIPLHTDVEEWGTKWFPQTIYVDYGNYEELGIEWGRGEFGIVAEYWYPNDIIKYHNLIAKFLSVYFMFYLFIPRIKDVWD